MISITLPSIYPSALARAIHSIADVTRGSHEIIVVSPFYASGPNVVWVSEPERKGCSAAHSLAFQSAKGEFVTAWADDHDYVDGWDELALDDFRTREQVFLKSGGKGPFELGLRHTTPRHLGTEFGIYYPYFPFMRTEDVKKVGGWLPSDYWGGFSDSDLALRVWSSGGRCEWSKEGLVIPHEDNFARTYVGGGAVWTPADMALFLQRWAPRYGAGWDTSNLRRFNIDLIPERYPELIDDTGRSIFFNRPEFATITDGNRVLRV
jgi:hypothetical protein